MVKSAFKKDCGDYEYSWKENECAIVFDEEDCGEGKIFSRNCPQKKIGLGIRLTIFSRYFWLVTFENQRRQNKFFPNNCNICQIQKRH